MNIHHLQVFDAVARSGSIGAAALLLDCTQPTVSHHLAAFERQLGTALFVRGRRGAELTDRGSALLEHAKLILAQIDAAERAVKDATDLRTGLLNVGAFGTAGTTFLARVLEAYASEHPDIELHVEEVDRPADALEAIRTRRLDVAFAYAEPGHWLRPMPGVLVRQIMLDPLVLILPEGHPLGGRDEVALAELAAEPWITNRTDSDPCHRLFVNACNTAGFDPTIRARIDSFSMVGELVRAGVGIALLPRLALPLVRAGLAILPIVAPAPARAVFVLSLADSSSMPRLAFLRLLAREDLALGTAPGGGAVRAAARFG